MNAKSLSTILHLKSLTEQAEREKEAREREAKSSEQVALAARLAENAKERVTEEALKEKKVRFECSHCIETFLFRMIVQKLNSCIVCLLTNDSFWKTGSQIWRKSVNE